MSDSTGPVHIEVFSDYACPFCYLGKWDAGRLAEEMAVEVCWRPFELRAEGTPLPDPNGEYLRTAWANVFRLAEERGVEIRRPSRRPRTANALEAAEFARGQGMFDAFHDAVFRAFFLDDADIGDPETLAGLAEQIGFDGAGLRGRLREGTYRAEVEARTEEGRQRGVDGVPTFFIGDRVVEGAEGVDALLKACQEARSLP